MQWGSRDCSWLQVQGGRARQVHGVCLSGIPDLSRRAVLPGTASCGTDSRGSNPSAGEKLSHVRSAITPLIRSHHRRDDDTTGSGDQLEVEDAIGLACGPAVCRHDARADSGKGRGRELARVCQLPRATGFETF